MKCNHGAVPITLVGLLATLGILGCGGGRSEPVAIGSGSQSGGVESYATVAQAADQGPQTGSPQVPQAAQSDTLPPDVVALAADTVAAPGAIIEIAARASEDAVEVLLWDGIARRQSFAYDSTENVWRTRYRVPLAATGRLGLAVIAKNDHGLRHRVWVFVRITDEDRREGEEESEAGPASTGS